MSGVMNKNYIDLNEVKIKKLEAENKAIREYAQHQGACKFSKFSEPCTCGLDSLLKGAK